MTFLRAILFIVTVSLLAGGCGKSGNPTPPPPTTAAVGTATIRGKVIYPGKAPPRGIVCGAGICHENSPAVLDESVIVNDNGTLRNVIVYLKDAPPGNGGGPAVELDQQDCRYSPHVIALQVFQPLIVKNSDPQLHNVDLHSQLNQVEGGNNFQMFAHDAHQPITFKAPEFFEIKCDVHPWMDCQVGVFDHPYFAVTGEDGSFEIRNVPAGNYTLVARHERYGEISEPVVATDNQTTNVYFTFQQP